MSLSGNPYMYSMDKVQPIGAGIYAEVDNDAGGNIEDAGRDNRSTTAAKLVIPRTDHLPILPDAGHVTDIVSTTTDTPWFADEKPDLRKEAYEKPTC